MDSDIEIEVDLLSCGEVRCRRTLDKDKNKALIEFLKSNDIETEELEAFLRDGECIIQLVGDETMCG